MVQGGLSYRAILVYDVSRWGRFQDNDEAAHYEFLCKSAGVPVHYCTESFDNDGSLGSLLMKALKRSMAGEYSRELGVKVLDGQRRGARLGFKQGGCPGYGLRRMLISADGTPKQALRNGERKSLITDRVRLVPGPNEEVAVVREIYKMLLEDGLAVYAIACRLNERGIRYTGVSTWDYLAVHNILTHPKYAGFQVFGRTSARLYTPVVRLPKSEWILKENAFPAIIDRATFLSAQQLLLRRTINRTDAELLESLKTLLAKEGRLCRRVIDDAPDMASPSAYIHRFGSLRRAYECIAYDRPEQFGSIDSRSRTRLLREELLARIAALFPKDVAIVSRGNKWRSKLRLRNGRMVSVLIAPAVRIRVRKDPVRWRVSPVKNECRFAVLLARLTPDNRAFMDFHVFPRVDRKGRFDLRLTDPWLGAGHCLKDLSELCTYLWTLKRKRL